MIVRDHHTEPPTAELLAHFGFDGDGPRAPFLQLQEAMLGHGALPTRTRELIALAVCIAGRREDCVCDHVRQALTAGASRAEVLETIGAAILMGGPESLYYGQTAADAIEVCSG